MCYEFLYFDENQSCTVAFWNHLKINTSNKTGERKSLLANVIVYCSPVLVTAYIPLLLKSYFAHFTVTTSPVPSYVYSTLPVTVWCGRSSREFWGRPSARACKITCLTEKDQWNMTPVLFVDSPWLVAILSISSLILHLSRPIQGERHIIMIGVERQIQRYVFLIVILPAVRLYQTWFEQKHVSNLVPV